MCMSVDKWNIESTDRPVWGGGSRCAAVFHDAIWGRVIGPSVGLCGGGQRPTVVLDLLEDGAGRDQGLWIRWRM